jgi:glyoxylase I family protein
MSSLEEKLRELELKVMTAAGERRADDIRDLVADDFFEIGRSGTTYTKAEVLAAIEVAPLRKFTLEDFKIVAGGDGWALVSYRAGERTAYSSTTSLRSTLWVERGGKWQVAFHQGTPITS